MSENVDEVILQQLTLLSADSLASLTVLPGSDEAQRMTAISGLNLAALLPNSNPATSLLRMFLESLPPISTRCYLIWNVLTTPVRRLIFRLSPLMPLTADIESSLLPTAQARDWKGPQGRAYKGESMDLPAAVLWPTPRANTAMAATITDEADEDRFPNLETVLKKRDSSTVGGQLNPTWVEWLMGFPLGWTDLEDSETP